MRRSDIAKKLEDLEKEVRELKEEVRRGREYMPCEVPYYSQPANPWSTNPLPFPNPFPHWTGCGENDAIGPMVDGGCQTVFGGAEGEPMIINCGYCMQDTAGNHEWNCPCNPYRKPDGAMCGSIAIPSETIRIVDDQVFRKSLRESLKGNADIWRSLADV